MMTLGTLAEKESQKLEEKQRSDSHSTLRALGLAVEIRVATGKECGAGSPKGGPEQTRATPELRQSFLGCAGAGRGLKLRAGGNVPSFLS